MNIYAQRGDKVVFAYPKNGWEGVVQTAKTYLKGGQIYTVDYTEVGQSRTYVYLIEFPEAPFNSVQFEDVVEEMKVYNVTNSAEMFEKIIALKFDIQRIASQFQNEGSYTNEDEIDGWLKQVNNTISKLDDIRKEGHSRFQLRE